MFSVVIPLYNKAHTIQRTLASVLAQTHTEFEVIIVNDGSTDNGIEAINQCTSDQRIRIIKQENQGVSAARNNGVANAKYEYIAFLDGDDEWLPGYLAKMKTAIDLFPNAGMYCCAGIVRNADGSEFYRLAKKYGGRILEIDFFENPHVFVHTSATVVSKSVFNKSGGFPSEMKRNQDFALFYSLALITPVVYCAFPLSVYVGGVEGQATSNNSTEIQKHVINRFNYVYTNWVLTGCANSTFKIFIKYEIRHIFISILRRKQYELFGLYINNLDQGIIRLFSSLELYLYQRPILRKMNIFHILLTKVLWRLNGYPRVNKSS